MRYYPRKAFGAMQARTGYRRRMRGPANLFSGAASVEDSLPWRHRGAVRLKGEYRVKIAILDDYQQVAKQSADWSSLPAGTEVDSFGEHIADAAELARRLQPYEVIVAMRERTRFPA